MSSLGTGLVVASIPLLRGEPAMDSPHEAANDEEGGRMVRGTSAVSVSVRAYNPGEALVAKGSYRYRVGGGC